MLSIISATHKSGQKINQLLTSVMSQQHYERIQVIVKDSGYDPKIHNTISQFNCDVELIVQSDGSIAEAWNQAIPYAKYPWVLFMGDDDKLVSEVDIVELLEKVPSGYQLAYGKVNKEYAPGQYRIDGKYPTYEMKNLLHFNTMPHQAFFQKRELFQDFSFNPKYEIASDYDSIIYFLQRTNFNPTKIYFFNLVISEMPYGGKSSMPKNAFKAFLEFQSIKKHHNLPDSLTFRFALFKAIIKTWLGRAGILR